MNRGRVRQCAGKVRHATYSHAQIALARTIEVTGDAGLMIYECRHCAGFHVGHAPKKEQRRMKYSQLIDAIDRANAKGAA